MNKSAIIGTFIMVCIPLFVLILCNISIANIDKEVWNETIKHSDEFVFNMDNSDHKFVIMNLYDKDSTYLCEAFIDVKNGKVAIFSHHYIIASSANKYKSRKMFKLLYKNIPEDVLSDYSPQDDVLNKLKAL